MSGPSTPVRTTRERWRVLLHAVVALLGWILFVRFWGTVFARTPPAEAVRQVLFLSLLLLLAVAATLAWVRHNIRLFRHRSRRIASRDVRVDYRWDALGQPVAAPPWEDVRTAPEIEVSVASGRKTFRIF